MERQLTIRSGKTGPVTNTGTKETQRIFIIFIYLGLLKVKFLDDEIIKFKKEYYIVYRLLL